MQILKKYGAIIFLITVFPTIAFIAKNLILEPSNEIYSFIPQESDFVVEINTGNFASELAYQRIFEETYFNEKVYPKTDDAPEEKLVETGIDLFGKIILFREQWADETIWIGLMKYTDEEVLKNFFLTQIPEAHFEFSGDYAIVQLSASDNQEKLNEHLKRISNKEVKAFSERVDLASVFDPNKEINCYIIPKNTAHNQLIDGSLSFDFLDDHIAIEGTFTPVSGFNETAPIAYSVNSEKAFSLRSSLNILNSIYLFSDEKFENIPEYSQMVLDYNGVDCYMIHKSAGFTTPFKSYPKIDLHIDLLSQNLWHSFFDTLQINNQIDVDTAKGTFITPQGASFSYVLNDEIFELKQAPFELSPANSPDVYFDLYMSIDPMIENTVFLVDDENPPSRTEQFAGRVIADGIMNEIRAMASMETISFQLTGTGEDQISANGRIDMKEKNGQSMVESLSFGISALLFLKNY